jgi:hypothetical protein
MPVSGCNLFPTNQHRRLHAHVDDFATARRASGSGARRDRGLISLPVGNEPSHGEHSGPEDQRENRGHFHFVRDYRGSIQFFRLIVNNGAEDEAMYANQAQNDHLGPEERVGSVLFRLRGCEEQARADHDRSPHTFPQAEAGDHLGDCHAVKREPEKAQVRHKDHAAEQPDARQMSRQNDRVRQHRLAEVREKANALERVSDSHAG